MKTAMTELISLIPDAREIKEFISEVQPDEKMLDEWLWEKMFKGKNWLEKEKEQIIDAHTNAYLIGEDDISVEDANKASEKYYNQTYTKTNNL
jgi:nitrous oxide reductase accessory protein NosL